MQPSPPFYLAFIAGMGSIMSPCVLPLIPAYVLSVAPQGTARTRLAVNALGFISGFSLVFILMGLSATALGGLLARHLEALRKIGAVIVILLGLHLTGVYRLAFLQRTAQVRTIPALGRWRPLLLGILFAFGWTPCVGPILASILIVAGSSGDPVKGGLLLAAYSAGFSLPFILAAVFADRVTRGFRSLGPYLAAISRVSGLGLVFLGILLYMNRL